ncbi:hypothetical protein OIO90_002894 [Microbotryomycetes sp. JL221]|nr:hypothetical protein OIO90_002894 [Microbotryomycetes sp. JL221]
MSQQAVNDEAERQRLLDPELVDRNMKPQTTRQYLGSTLLGGQPTWSSWTVQIGLLLAFVPLWTTLATHPAGLFTYHPAIQSFAIILFIQGIILLQPQPKDFKTKQKGLKLHQIVQYTALPLIVAGSAVIVYNKIVNKGKHLYSWHGWCGTLTLFLIVAQITFGAIIVYSPLTQLVGGSNKAKQIWKFHRMSGYVTLSLLLLTPLLAVDSDWIQNNTTRVERIVMTGGLVLVAIGVTARISTQKLGF